jgi:hypothetical protein
MQALTLAVGILGTVIVGLIGLIVIWRLWTGEISLSQLLSDSSAASLSRFQFLVFTFIIGLSYFLLVIHLIAKGNLSALPSIDGNVLALIGISAGSYVVSKGIQKSAETAVAKAQIAAAPAAPVAPLRAHGAIP